MRVASRRKRDGRQSRLARGRQGESEEHGAVESACCRVGGLRVDAGAGQKHRREQVKQNRSEMNVQKNWGAERRVDFWTRETQCLRREEGKWLIVDEHPSIPLHLDGSLRPAFDLQP